MFTFSRNIELEFCPTCFQTLDYPDYINGVTTRITSAHHYQSRTYTGEMVNSCTKVPPEIAQLEAAYPNLEVYAASKIYLLLFAKSILHEVWHIAIYIIYIIYIIYYTIKLFHWL